MSGCDGAEAPGVKVVSVEIFRIVVPRMQGFGVVLLADLREHRPHPSRRLKAVIRIQNETVSPIPLTLTSLALEPRDDHLEVAPEIFSAGVPPDYVVECPRVNLPLHGANRSLTVTVRNSLERSAVVGI